MKEMDKKKQEVLQDLSRRFRESANTLKNVARKIDLVAQSHMDTLKRMERSSRRLQEQLMQGPDDGHFTYLEFLEFTSVEEFHRFKNMGPISEQEIADVDWDALLTQLDTPNAPDMDD